MFVVTLTYTRPLAEVDALRPKHMEFLDKYYAQDVFLASGRQNPPVGGVIIARGVTREQLEALVQEDPFLIEKVATCTITEFMPNKFNAALKDFV